MPQTRITANPTLQEILDKDTAVHNYLISIATDKTVEDSEAMRLILAQGLSAIHDRLGEMFRYDKAIKPS
jgi:hypothetical protein